MQPFPRLFDQILVDLRDTTDSVIDREVAKDVIQKLGAAKTRWRDLLMFWPPRAVRALGEGRVVPFLGAGISLAAGIPSWTELLREHLKLTSAYAEDKDLEHDPLTMAEIASQRNGATVVQSTLRQLTERARQPTSAHIMLAALRCPVYITTNYDDLLETAWHKVSNGGEMRVIVNDATLVELGSHWSSYYDEQRPLLFKIHGCVRRTDEQLILTRHDYRHHYRANQRFFAAIRELLHSRHVLFAGFSHRDPEVTRLVEDAIYEFESSKRAAPPPAADARPHFYSLQFDMLEHTPEIFAAKGLVALKPPFYPAAGGQGRALSLCVALGELADSLQGNLHRQVSIDDDLHTLAQAMSTRIEAAVDAMRAQSTALIEALRTHTPTAACQELVLKLGELAGQGIYLLDPQGRVRDCAVPAGLSAQLRKDAMPRLSERPYFRIAKSFREPYVSDTVRSVFNGNSTVTICHPLMEDMQFKGLVFAASHVGTWPWLMAAAAAQWQQGRSVILIDSLGVALFPPNNELQLRRAEEIRSHLLLAGEDAAANIGYCWEDLFALSRRDALIKHLVENIVPLTQDDDVFEIGSDFEYYSVVTEIPHSRWKLAIAQPFVRRVD